MKTLKKLKSTIDCINNNNNIGLYQAKLKKI